MSNALTQTTVLPPNTLEAKRQLDAIEAELAKRPQIEIPVEHHLHAGVYSRTIRIPKGVAAVGVEIKRATQLIISGHVRLSCGDKVTELSGYHVLDGLGGRKQVAFALEDTYCTMLFATNAKTIQEAENEFTDEPQRLQTRKERLQCQV